MALMRIVFRLVTRWSSALLPENSPFRRGHSQGCVSCFKSRSKLSSPCEGVLWRRHGHHPPHVDAQGGCPRPGHTGNIPRIPSSSCPKLKLYPLYLNQALLIYRATNPLVHPLHQELLHLVESNEHISCTGRLRYCPPFSPLNP